MLAPHPRRRERERVPVDLGGREIKRRRADGADDHIHRRTAGDGEKGRQRAPWRLGERQAAQRVHDDQVRLAAHPARREAMPELMQQHDREQRGHAFDAVQQRAAGAQAQQQHDSDQDDQRRMGAHFDAERPEQFHLAVKHPFQRPADGAPAAGAVVVSVLPAHRSSPDPFLDRSDASPPGNSNAFAETSPHRPPPNRSYIISVAIVLAS